MVEWQISFLPEVSTERFIQGLFTNQTIEIGDKKSVVQFHIRSVEVLPPPEYAEEMQFSTMSPICLRCNHDLGKVNGDFQRKQMKNAAKLIEVEHHFHSNHSVISMYLFLAIFWSDFLSLKLSDEDAIFLCNVALFMSYPICQHHSTALYQTEDDKRWKNEELFDLKPYLSLFKSTLNDERIEQFHAMMPAVLAFNRTKLN